MYKLNDDVLLSILDYLPFADQFSLIYAFPEYKTFIKNNWKTQCKVNLIINFREQCLSPNEFEELLQMVHENVQVIKLFGLNFELFQTFSKFLYAEAVSLQFTQTIYFPINESDLLLLLFKLPKLKEFNPHGLFTGKYFDDLFPQLEVLSVCESYNICNHKFQKTFENLSLRSICLGYNPQLLTSLANIHRFKELERISLSGEQYSQLFDMVESIPLPNLREIIFSDNIDNEIFRSDFCINSSSCLKLVEEHINLRQRLLPFSINPKSKDVLRFCLNDVMFDRNYNMLPGSTASILRDLANMDFNNLQDIILYGVIFMMPSDVELIFQGIKLSLLSIECCSMHFESFVLDMENVHMTLRKKPLTINWYENSSYPPKDLLRNMQTPKKLSTKNTKLCPLRVLGKNPLVKISALPMFKHFNGSIKLILESKG